MELTNAAAPQTLHLHWVCPGAPYSRTVRPGELPGPLALALAGHWSGLPTVELHLPSLPARLPEGLEAWAARLRFTAPAPGLLLGDDPREAEPGAARPLDLAHFLTGPELPVPLTIAPPPLPPGPFAPPAAPPCRTRAGAWSAAPPERSRDYFAVYSRVSLALQQALRDTVPALVFSGPEPFDDPRHAWPLLAWSATPPHVGRHVDRLTYDLLDEGMRARFLAAVARHLPARLARLEPLLAGHPGAEAFLPARGEAWAAASAPGSLALRQLLEAETAVIHALIRLAAEASGWTRRAERERALSQRVAAIGSRLRRLTGRAPAAGAAPALLAALLGAMTRSLDSELATLPRRAA